MMWRFAITTVVGPVHIRPEKFENATTSGHFGLCLRKTWAGESRDYREVMVFEKNVSFVLQFPAS